MVTNPSCPENAGPYTMLLKCLSSLGSHTNSLWELEECFPGALHQAIPLACRAGEFHCRFAVPRGP
jgi:hypothetical protein